MPCLRIFAPNFKNHKTWALNFYESFSSKTSTKDKINRKQNPSSPPKKGFQFNASKCSGGAHLPLPIRRTMGQKRVSRFGHQHPRGCQHPPAGCYELDPFSEFSGRRKKPAVSLEDFLPVNSTRISEPRRTSLFCPCAYWPWTPMDPRPTPCSPKPGLPTPLLQPVHR